MKAEDELGVLFYIDASGARLVLSADIARAVGWGSRTAGGRMTSLEKRGLVRRVKLKAGTPRTDAKNGWALTDKGRALIRGGGKRRLPSAWTIQVCPGCNGLVGELTHAHLGDCEYRNTSFVPRTVLVEPARPAA